MIYQAKNLSLEELYKKLSIGDRVNRLKSSDIDSLLNLLRQKYSKVRFSTFNYTKDGYVDISILGSL